MSPALARLSFSETAADMESDPSHLERARASFRSHQALNLEARNWCALKCFPEPSALNAVNVKTLLEARILVQHWEHSGAVFGDHVDSNARFACRCGFWLGWTFLDSCQCETEWDARGARMLWTGYAYDDLDLKFHHDTSHTFDGESAAGRFVFLRNLEMVSLVDNADLRIMDAVADNGRWIPGRSSSLACSFARFDFLVALRGLPDREVNAAWEEDLHRIVAVQANEPATPGNPTLVSLDAAECDTGSTPSPAFHPAGPVFPATRHGSLAGAADMALARSPPQISTGPLALQPSDEMGVWPSGTTTWRQRKRDRHSNRSHNHRHPAPVLTQADPAALPSDESDPGALQTLADAAWMEVDTASTQSSEDTAHSAHATLSLDGSFSSATGFAGRRGRRTVTRRRLRRVRPSPRSPSTTPATQGCCKAWLTAVVAALPFGWAHVWTAGERLRPPD